MRRLISGVFAKVLALGVLLFGAHAFAQAPGPMSRAHREMSSFPLDCNKCHSSGFGVPDDKCLSCHTHQPLRARIRAGKGLHATPDVKKKACRDCHAEHVEAPPGSGKGRRSTIDWQPFGGKRNFNHSLAGWPLDGAHRFVKCETCHTKKYPKSKLPTYLGLRKECTTCHAGTDASIGIGGKNPHKFTDQALTDCLICHSFKGRKVPNLGSTKFDHDKTDFPISGEHMKQACVSCHKNIKTFKIEKKLKDCSGCHKDVHRSIISHKRRCSSCHQTKVKFRRTRFAHESETNFPLIGKHQKNECADCHKVGSPRVKPKMECSACHKDPHKGRFKKESCESCHYENSFKKIQFDHTRKTKFGLQGAHADASCVSCHRFGIGPEFERFKTGECADCHRHEDAHCGQFGKENCERCHVQGGDRTSKFDHNFTRFPLVEAHNKASCERCHKPQKLGESRECRRSIKYTGLDPECGSCHSDLHEGSLGTECSKCHTGGINFKTLVFEHKEDSRFPLTGFHQLIECKDCHPSRGYRMEDFRCASCHAKDDLHEGRLGDDCAKCHETTGGAPKFDHNLQTSFPQTGIHARLDCARCHYLDDDGRSPFEGQTASSTVSKIPPANSSKTKAKASFSKGQVDLLFRSAGAKCVACHADPHQVRDDLDCEGCHTFDAWAPTSGNSYHETPGFSLGGAHTVVACTLCHTGGGSLRGRGESCGQCHVQDDTHAGSFGSECGKCHEQLGWLPTRFAHVDTGYVLEGIHRTLDCRSCHQAGNYFVGNQCYNCHLSDYRGATDWHQVLDTDQNATLADPNRFFITGGSGAWDPDNPVSFDCGECHNQFTFSLGTFADPPP